MSLDLATRSAAEGPLQGTAELVAWIRGAEKPVSQWRVGVEHEKIGVRADGSPIPYEGPAGIRALLEALAAQTPGAKLHAEAGNPIAVLEGQASITLEPGGQLELSGAPVRRLSEAKAEIERHLEAVARASGPLGIRWLMLGYRPWNTPAQMPWMPKLRYGEMRRSLAPKGRLAQDMMLMTATVQANLDWSDERDLAAKVRTATLVSPIVSALFSNSPIVDGRDSGLQDFRYQVWRETDPARCGLLEQMLRPGWGYQQYVEWALGVPLLFVRHEGRYLSGEGKTFRDWMERGRLDGLASPPTLTNFTDHLTTLFPEVRVKRVLELRGADVVPMPLLLSLPALWVGALYDRQAREEAASLTAHLSFGQLLELQAAVARDALAAKLPGGGSVAHVARELVQICRAGLQRWGAESGADESAMLDPLEALLREATPLSGKLLLFWKRANRDVASVIHSTAIA
jgi:glutamate--cysteine ligase